MVRLGTLLATSMYDTPPQPDISDVGLENKVGLGVFRQRIYVCVVVWDK